MKHESALLFLFKGHCFYLFNCSMQGCVFPVTVLCFLCIINWGKVHARGASEIAVLSLAMVVILVPREARVCNVDTVVKPHF